MSDSVIITVAPSIPPPVAAIIPGLDLSPEGIAAEVMRSCGAGASIAHLHVWDERGQPTTDLSAFRRTLRLIREGCDIIIEGSTGGLTALTPAERCVALQAEVEMASLNPGSVNYDAGVYVNAPDDVGFWAREMSARGIKPDFAIFEAGMIATSVGLAEQGLFASPLCFGLVLGQQGAMPASPRNLVFLVDSLPAGAVWTACGHGGHDLRMAALAIAAGGHARAGFEDNPYYRPGELATSNAQLVERLARMAREVGRPVASPTDARKILGLAP